MNRDQITGILRAVLPAVLAYAVGRGWLPEGVVADISAAVFAVLAAVWSFVNNSTASKATAVAREEPTVQIVVPQSASEEIKSVAGDPKVPNVGFRP